MALLINLVIFHLIYRTISHLPLIKSPFLLILVLQEKIDEHDSQFKDILSEKYAKIERYKRQIENLKDDSKDDIAKHM